ncbi:DNA-protecting protein DprA [Nostocoides sp. F2B08]|uniref:DNA-processing protein DprA n=1 Tax=Nostocoides sp. F2B08 TaxID=2653936 RepID=UPI001263B0C2|nr:DNA-processing protein DprA [Tetrasphaera sp. F2B08]KAB7746041.1 DNA-protecting protein DprA [Tetrasphaera sp. F2B08]
MIRIGALDERTARVALSRLGEPGLESLRDAVARFGAAETLERLRGGTLTLTGVTPSRFDARTVEEDVRKAERLGARVVIPADAEWPRQLSDLPVPPLCLWVRGPIDVGEATERSIALVGARSATSYGSQVAADLAAGLCERGFAIISGGAFGIDAAAHRGALAVDGATVAVMAGGIDRLYPASHSTLLGEITRTGAIVTEQPPGTAPIGSRFLGRNRLIAALGCGTVVVEASLRSGSLNTAGHAQTINRPVAVVPGPVTSMQSAGCHFFVRERGAELVTDAAEVAELVGRMGFDLAPVKRGERRALDDLEPDERVIFELLPLRKYADVAALAAASGLDPMTVRAALGILSARGDAVSDGLDGWRKAPADTRRGR